jgi:hypothetical protein
MDRDADLLRARELEERRRRLLVVELGVRLVADDDRPVLLRERDALRVELGLFG